MKVYVVGIKSNGDPNARKKVRHMKGVTNPKWAAKYAKAAGEFAGFATTEVDSFESTPPEEIAKLLADAADTSS